MKVAELSKSWAISLNATYSRLKKMRVSLDEIKILNFDEINELYLYFSKWRVVDADNMFHVYPPHKPSFSLEFIPKVNTLHEAVKIILRLRKSHYTRRESWYSNTKYEGYNVITFDKGKVTFYGHDFTSMFTLAQNYYKKNIIEDGPK